MSYKRLVLWDMGGPLRDSSDSMGHALKEAARHHLYEINLDNKLMWQLWSVKGPVLGGTGGDYTAWFKAALALEIEATERSLHPDELCRYLFEREDPTTAVAEVVERTARERGLTEDHCGPVGEMAYSLFGNDPETKAKSRVNDGALKAVELLYNDGTPMGVVTSAPKGNTEIWLDTAIRGPLVSEGRIPSDSRPFHSQLIRSGKAAKSGHLIESVQDARLITYFKLNDAWYIADTNDDITETYAANRELERLGRPRIKLVMVRNGMGFPKMWAGARKQTTFREGEDYFEFGNSEEAARYIIGASAPHGSPEDQTLGNPED